MNAGSKNYFENKTLQILVLILVPVCLYYKSLFYDFSPLDEQWLILNDAKQLLKEWSSLLKAFKQLISSIYYRPLLQASFIVDFHLGQTHPFVYHFSNVLFHLASVLLLFKLLLQLRTERKTALALSLLFSVHPALLHAVAWIPGRNDSLLAIFSLLAFITLLNYLRHKKTLSLVLHLLCFATALFVKESAMLLPFAFAVLFFVEKGFSKQLLVLAGTWLVLLAGWYALKSQLVSYVPKPNDTILLSLQRFVAGMIVFFGKVFFPFWQSVAPTPKNSTIVPGLLALVLLFFLYIKIGVRDKRTALAGVFIFFCLIALPVWFGAINPIGEQYEHRVYTPMIGMMIFFSQLKFNLNSKWLMPTFLLVLILFIGRSSMRMRVYENRDSFLAEGIRHCPENFLFHTQLGSLHYERRNFEAAISCYSEAIHLRPKRSESYHYRGKAYTLLSDSSAAFRDLKQAVSLSPDQPDIRLSLCRAYFKFANYQKAMEELQTLWRCCRNVVPTDLAKEVTKRWAGQQMDRLNAQIAASPGDALLYVERAKLYNTVAMNLEALADLKKAMELEPSNTEYPKYYEELKASMMK